MRPQARYLLALILSLQPLSQAPGQGSEAVRIAPGGIVNAATYKAEDLSRGTIGTIFGSFDPDNSIPDAGVQASYVDAADGPRLPTSLAGVTVYQAGREAPLFFVNDGQINFQVLDATGESVPFVAKKTTAQGDVFSNEAEVDVGASPAAAIELPRRNPERAPQRGDPQCERRTDRLFAG